EEDEDAEAGWRWVPVYVCTDPAVHGHHTRWASTTRPTRKPVEQMTDDEREAARAERRTRPPPAGRTGAIPNPGPAATSATSPPSATPSPLSKNEPPRPQTPTTSEPAQRGRAHTGVLGPLVVSGYRGRVSRRRRPGRLGRRA